MDFSEVFIIDNKTGKVLDIQLSERPPIPILSENDLNIVSEEDINLISEEV